MFRPWAGFCRGGWFSQSPDVGVLSMVRLGQDGAGFSDSCAIATISGWLSLSSGHVQVAQKFP